MSDKIHYLNAKNKCFAHTRDDQKSCKFYQESLIFSGCILLTQSGGCVSADAYLAREDNSFNRRD